MVDQIPNPYTADYKVIPAEHVKSLVWSGDLLIDWVSGGVVYTLDGTKTNPRVNYAYRFDAAVVSPSGTYAALYERLGTKAILVGSNWHILRELNRSFYHASAYEYPILFVGLPDGREALVHCPREYCHLEIEDPVTGNQWSAEGTGRLQSLFHSRLAVNSVGSRLLSAGWVWHPFNTARVFDLEQSSDGQFKLLPCDDYCNGGTEINSAAFNSAGQLVITAAKDADDFLDDEPGERLRPGMIGRYDLDGKKLVSLASLEDEAGTIMPVGNQHVVGFFNHPKLIEVATGRVMCRWPELGTGQQLSSILWHKPLPPPIALDPSGGRFAVASDKQITVVVLSVELVSS